MDPAVDTGFDEGVNEETNAVNPTGAEAQAFGTGIPPELYPEGAPEEPAAANPIPGSDSAAVVRAGPLAAIGLADLPANDDDALPTPPAHFHDGHEAAQEGLQTMEDPLAPVAGAPSDDDDDMGDDLFGEDGASDDDQEMAPGGEAIVGSPQPEVPVQQARSPSPADGLTAEERARRHALEYEEEDYGGAAAGEDDLGAGHVLHTQEEVIAQLPLANLSVPPGGKVWHARMPHFLQIQTGAFDARTWEPEDPIAASQQQDSQDAAGASQQEDVKPRTVPDENVIRWRWTKDELGQVIKRSNARIVRWSDNSLSLQLGSELFDMTLAVDHSATLTATGAAAAGQSSSISTDTTPLVASAFDLSRGHGLTYLSARHAYNGSLSETQASVHGSMTFRPATLASQTHRRLAGSIAGRYATQGRRGTQKAEMPLMDPEKMRQQREKAELDRAKKARREAAKAAGGSKRSGGRRAGGKKATTIEGLDLSDDEDDDDDDEGGAGGAYGRRSQPKRGRGGPLAAREYSDDDDGFVAQSDEDMDQSDGGREEIEEVDAAAEREERRRKDRQKRRDAAASDSDDDGAAAAPAEGTQAAPRRRLVVESDEDE
ncbi:Paf1 complex component [Rhodotorula kratochvilovae]